MQGRIPPGLTSGFCSSQADPIEVGTGIERDSGWRTHNRLHGLLSRPTSNSSDPGSIIELPKVRCVAMAGNLT